MKNLLKVGLLHGIISMKGLNEQYNKKKARTKQFRGGQKHSDKRYGSHPKGRKIL